eukprot:GAHX01001572.1.p1 GENE.GAHX01001572.1~~GAHX01001572.1.p1  ORF type:complete len:1685 (-),score=280.62 GAHX01001572.1:48-5102(-)
MDDRNKPDETPKTYIRIDDIQKTNGTPQTKRPILVGGYFLPTNYSIPRNKVLYSQINGVPNPFAYPMQGYRQPQFNVIPTTPIKDIIQKSKENEGEPLFKNMNVQSADFMAFNLFTYIKLDHQIEQNSMGPFTYNEILGTEYYPTNRIMGVRRHLNSLYLLINSKPLQYAPSHLAQILFEKYKLAYTGENLKNLEQKKKVLQNKISKEKYIAGSMTKKNKSKLVRTHIEYHNKECRWTSNFFSNFAKSRRKKTDNIIRALEQKEKTSKNAIIREQKNNAKKIARELKVTMKNILKLVKAKSELYQKKAEKNEILYDLKELFGSAVKISQVITGLLKETKETPWNPAESKLLKIDKDKPLREYQIRGISWLLGLFKNNTNGILADDMGLGKTVQTIALFSRLAEEYDMWGPYLIIVPNSVVINWSVEFLKWMPGFKLLVYHGDQNQRKAKRVGWNKKNAFNAVIVGYSTAVNDISFIKRKKWLAMVLDEAHSIKNSSSKRWQQLLSIKAHRRILLTGTPLQNSVMELWALLHFLMPGLFKSSEAFKEWFSKPLSSKSTDITGAMKEINEGSTTSRSEKLAITRLKGLIMPFVLRRLKTEVNLGLPEKTEELIVCKFSKRQRQLYEDFLSRGKTKRVLKEGKYLNMMGVLTKLRKVCNHPDLFEGKSVTTPLRFTLLSDYDEFFGLFKSEINQKVLNNISYSSVFKETVPHNILGIDTNQDTVNEDILANIHKKETTIIRLQKIPASYTKAGITIKKKLMINSNNNDFKDFIINRATSNQNKSLFLLQNRTSNKCNIVKNVVTGRNFNHFVFNVPSVTRKINITELLYYNKYKSHEEKAFSISRYNHLLKAKSALLNKAESQKEYNKSYLTMVKREIRYSKQRRIPDPISLLNECGKLQRLERLLETLIRKGHRCVIFSLMVKMLDIIEFFLSRKNFSYLRLDGSTPLELRQARVDRFNADQKIFCFITSTKSGGLGINLTGADTVIFYDSDWNPSVDLQAQDRCHRLGQQKPVKVYKLITENTIEANIYCVAERKKRINKAVLDDGDMSVFDEESAVVDIFMGMTGDNLNDIPNIENSHNQVTESGIEPPENSESKPDQRNEFLDLISEQIDEKLQKFDEIYNGLSPLEKFLFNKIENNPNFYSDESKNSLAPEARHIERFSGASARGDKNVKRVLVSLGIDTPSMRKPNPFHPFKEKWQNDKINTNIKIYKKFLEKSAKIKNTLKSVCNLWRAGDRKKLRLEKLAASATEKVRYMQSQNTNPHDSTPKLNYNTGSPIATNVSINPFPSNPYGNYNFLNSMIPNKIVRKNKYDQLLKETAVIGKSNKEQNTGLKKQNSMGSFMNGSMESDFNDDFATAPLTEESGRVPLKRVNKKERLSMSRIIPTQEGDFGSKQEIMKNDAIYLKLISEFAKIEELNLLLFKFLDSYTAFVGGTIDGNSKTDFFSIVNGLFTTENHIHAFYEYIISRCSPRLKKYVYIDTKQNHIYFIEKLNKLAENNCLKYNVLKEELELEINIHNTKEKMNLFNKYKIVSHRAIQQQSITSKKLMLCSKMLLNQRGTPINGTNIMIRQNTSAMDMNYPMAYGQPTAAYNNKPVYKMPTGMAPKSHPAANYMGMSPRPSEAPARMVVTPQSNASEANKEDDLKNYIAKYNNAPLDLKNSINYIAKRPDINVDQKIEMIKQLTE